MGAPLAATANRSIVLSAAGSTCPSQRWTGNPCAFSWRVVCPNRPALNRTGATAAAISSGPSADVDIDLRGAPPTLLCSVTLTVESDWELTGIVSADLRVSSRPQQPQCV